MGPQGGTEISSSPSSVVDGILKPVMTMVAVQIAYAAMGIFYKLAADSGMNLNILVAYRLMFSSAIMIPLALIVERNSRPKLTLVVLFQAFLCGLFGGSLSQNLYIKGLALTSPTFSAAAANLIPAITYITAICFRLEKLTLGSHAGKAKLVGTVVGIAGAMVFTFYKGPEFSIWSVHVDLLRGHHPAPSSSHGSTGSHLLGAFFAFGSAVAYSMWLIVQAKMSKRYPCPYSSTALLSVMGSIQSVIFAVCVERDWSRWKLGWNIKLFTAAYTGIVASGMVVVMISWCVRKRGPLFVSVFAPLCLVIVAIASSLLLNENLSLGSVLGGTLIVCGLYMVLWGKSKEMKRVIDVNSDQEQPAAVPALPSSTRPQDSKLIEIVETTRAPDTNTSDNNNSNTIVGSS
ncbi:PREDICTED: WAT1-related protein At1g25270-like [Fragaria vesca subsp. vesca]|uniref:WAT1-related protein At1g25270-like n=1 Tax=Fragaria vesca subsp. vesca TaxID=101020 RepID=UPI0002C2FCAA|nr:PREDICTED: WAT1-related protein At1g25270-like [Fragaria vesca subsp. vesca]